MKEKIEKIKDKATSSPCKYIIIFLIVFFIVLFLSYILISDLEYKVDDQNIRYTDFTIVKKYTVEEGEQRYLIQGDDNNTYEMINDNKGRNTFKELDVGSHYRFVIKTPQDSNEQYNKVLQVYNETGGRKL